MADSGRIVPFHCPYCADENLWPHLAEGAETSNHGEWECRSCLRAFKLSMLTHLPRPAVPGSAEITR
ncbi:MAG: hypothetical protein ACR2FG_01020 [Marmoricola sp.]